MRAVLFSIVPYERQRALDFFDLADEVGRHYRELLPNCQPVVRRESRLLYP